MALQLAVFFGGVVLDIITSQVFFATISTRSISSSSNETQTIALHE
jgi:hypothetical protein